MSSQIEGAEADLRALTSADAAGTSGVQHECELLALAEAMVRGDESALAAAREAAIGALGPEGFVEAAAVGANFERMVRIADATGIPLDSPVDAVSASIRAQLGIDAFGSAANTPPVSRARKLLGRALLPFMRYVMAAMAWSGRRSVAAARLTPKPDERAITARFKR